MGLGGRPAGSKLTDVLLLLSEADWKPQVIVLPIPVPIFVPVPMHMYCQKVPVPFSMPVPVSNTLHSLVFSYWLNRALLQPPCFSVLFSCLCFYVSQLSVGFLRGVLLSTGACANVPAHHAGEHR